MLCSGTTRTAARAGPPRSTSLVQAGANLGCFPRWWLAGIATTEWVCSLDDDLCLAAPDALEAAIERARGEDCILGAFGVRLLPGRPYGDGVHLNTPAADERVDIVKGRFMLLRRALLERVPLHLPALDELGAAAACADDIRLSLCTGAGRPQPHLLAGALRGKLRELPASGRLQQPARPLRTPSARGRAAARTPEKEVEAMADLPLATYAELRPLLLPGDVLLCRDRSLLSRVIRAFQRRPSAAGGRWSHCALVDRLHDRVIVYESTFPKGRMTPLSEWLRGRRGRVCVGRPRAGRWRPERACAYTLSTHYRAYAWLDLLKYACWAVLGSWPGRRDSAHTLVCSELVGRALRAGGVRVPQPDPMLSPRDNAEAVTLKWRTHEDLAMPAVVMAACVMACGCGTLDRTGTLIGVTHQQPRRAGAPAADGRALGAAQRGGRLRRARASAGERGGRAAGRAAGRPGHARGGGRQRGPRPAGRALAAAADRRPLRSAGRRRAPPQLLRRAGPCPARAHVLGGRRDPRRRSSPPRAAGA